MCWITLAGHSVVVGAWTLPAPMNRRLPGARVPDDLMLGKRRAFLDLRQPAGKARFLELLAEAHVFMRTHRPEGIDDLVPPADRQRANLDLVEVAFHAYGWSGPWQLRRGFDSLTEFSTGLATAQQA